MDSLGYFARSFRERHDWQDKFSGLKYLIRSALHWRHHRDWLGFLQSHPLLRGTVRRHPRLQERYQHPYLCLGLDAAQRLRVLRNHYLAALRHMHPDAYTDIYIGNGLLCGPFVLRQGQQFHLRISACSGVECEGELRVALVDTASGRDISHASMSLTDRGRTLIVGCLQGARGEGNRDVIRDFTRESHGLRPKNLLLSIIYVIAQGMHARVLGVSGKTHPLQGRQGFVAPYDDFWQENGGSLDHTGFYLLPEYEAIRHESAVESKNRAAFRRRETLRQSVCATLSEALFRRGYPEIERALDKLLSAKTLSGEKLPSHGVLSG
jgi:uncharacterized protein VirK/YbjX